MNNDSLLNLTADMGYLLMASGAEIYRVEESMYRLLQAYGMRHALAHELAQFQVTMIETLGMAIALAVGSMISSSAFRTLWTNVVRLRTEKEKDSK